jgi:hypothetical protein
MDELTGAHLAANQWDQIHDEAQRDHPDHDETDSEHCPVCYQEAEHDD